MLTIAAGLLANSFIRLTAVQPGFDPSNVVAARVTVPALEMPRDMERDAMMALFRSWAGERTQFYEELERRVAALPGVQEVGLAFGLPFFPAHSFSRVVVPEGLIVEPGEEPVVSGNVIAGSYLEAMGIALRRGRAFDATDVGESVAVITVNEVMADLFWPGEDAIGKQIALGGADGTPVTVVGVVANVRQRSLAEDEPPMYYRPLAQAGWPDGMFVVVRTDGDPAGAVSSIRQQVWALNPELPLTDVSVATQLIDRSVAAPRFRTALLVTFSAFALLLSLVGIYGVIAYNVGERTHEMGVRMALGAQGATIVAMVVGQGLRLVAIGIAAGVLGAWGLTRFLRGMLFGVTGTDGLTFSATAVVFVTIAILASYGPARRAARADPLESLRSE
jgi:putative ABC transport system permease protein